MLARCRRQIAESRELLGSRRSWIRRDDMPMSQRPPTMSSNAVAEPWANTSIDSEHPFAVARLDRDLVGAVRWRTTVLAPVFFARNASASAGPSSAPMVFEPCRRTIGEGATGAPADAIAPARGSRPRSSTNTIAAAAIASSAASVSVARRQAGAMWDSTPSPSPPSSLEGPPTLWESCEAPRRVRVSMAVMGVSMRSDDGEIRHRDGARRRRRRGWARGLRCRQLREGGVGRAGVEEAALRVPLDAVREPSVEPLGQAIGAAELRRRARRPGRSGSITTSRRTAAVAAFFAFALWKKCFPVSSRKASKPERPHVGRRPDVHVDRRLLGRHPRGRTEDHAGCVVRSGHRLGDPEVEHLDHERQPSVARARQEDVGRLEVPVDDPARVGGGERVRDLAA